MPPRLLLPRQAILASQGLLRSSGSGSRQLRFYSSDAPLITVTRVRAPNTGHVRVLELNRPAARNAISRALLAALRGEFEQVAAYYDNDGNEFPQKPGAVDEDGPARALVIASAVDSVFCAGADLKERKGFTEAETREFLTNLRSTFSFLESLPIPTISAISSVALGGGLELALSTHLRVLTSNAIVGLPETRLGIIPGAGGTHRLPALIGLPRARDLILTGRRVAAPEAYFLGIADRLVEVLPEDETKAHAKPPGSKTPEQVQAEILTNAKKAALSEAVRLAFEICEGGPVAIRAVIQAVAWARPEVEDRMYERVIGTEDRNEALKAFQEKRKPVFKGR